MMYFREAVTNDFEDLHRIRTAVKENILSDPGRISKEDYIQYLEQNGKGWVCENSEGIVGFSIVSLEDRNVWALFIHPSEESKGIGSRLHDMMLDWFFSQTTETLWLSTDPGTRAEKFYRQKGWKESGMFQNEKKFEMTYHDWRK